MITQSELKNLLYYDIETGNFIRLIRTANAINVGDIAGCVEKTTGYISISVKGKQYLAHRLAWLYMKGEWPINQIDHKNSIKQDNKWINLREATSRQNAQNKRKALSNNLSTGILGVYPSCKNRFRAVIQHEGKQIYIGLFKTKEEAYEAYVNKKRELHEFCTI